MVRLQSRAVLVGVVALSLGRAFVELVEGVGPLPVGVLVPMNSSHLHVMPFAQVCQVLGARPQVHLVGVLATDALCLQKVIARASVVSSGAIIGGRQSLVLIRQSRVTVGRRRCLLEVLHTAQQIMEIIVEFILACEAGTEVATVSSEAAPPV